MDQTPAPIFNPHNTPPSCFVISKERLDQMDELLKLHQELSSVLNKSAFNNDLLDPTRVNDFKKSCAYIYDHAGPSYSSKDLPSEHARIKARFDELLEMADLHKKAMDLQGKVNWLEDQVAAHSQTNAQYHNQLKALYWRIISANCIDPNVTSLSQEVSKLKEELLDLIPQQVQDAADRGFHRPTASSLSDQQTEVETASPNSVFTQTRQTSSSDDGSLDSDDDVQTFQEVLQDTPQGPIQANSLLDAPLAPFPSPASIAIDDVLARLDDEARNGTGLGDNIWEIRERMDPLEVSEQDMHTAHASLERNNTSYLPNDPLANDGASNGVDDFPHEAWIDTNEQPELGPQGSSTAPNMFPHDDFLHFFDITAPSFDYLFSPEGCHNFEEEAQRAKDFSDSAVGLNVPTSKGIQSTETQGVPAEDTGNLPYARAISVPTCLGSGSANRSPNLDQSAVSSTPSAALEYGDDSPSKEKSGGLNLRTRPEPVDYSDVDAVSTPAFGTGE